MKNIGLAFIRMGQYSDAVQTLETIMDTMPDHQVSFKVYLCCTQKHSLHFNVLYVLGVNSYYFIGIVLVFRQD